MKHFCSANKNKIFLKQIAVLIMLEPALFLSLVFLFYDDFRLKKMVMIY
jgi:hypothetical protein